MLKQKKKPQPAATAAKQPKKAKRSAPAAKTDQPDLAPALPKPRSGSRALAKPINFVGDARVGQEGMSMLDYAIPRLAVLQDLSPQVKQDNPLYIEGAEPGDICDVVGGQLYDANEGTLVIPVSYRRTHIEWVTRKKGGGFVADHGPSGDIIAKCERGERGELTLPNGHEVKITAEYFVFLIEDEASGETRPFVVSMTGSQMKKARRWNTLINQFRVPVEGGESFNPAMFYRTYKFTTIPESNQQGSWFGWVITPDKNVVDLPNGEKIYIDARDFRESIKAGRVAATRPMEEPVATGAVDDEVAY
jgi:hypothetical protein